MTSQVQRRRQLPSIPTKRGGLLADTKQTRRFDSDRFMGAQELNCKHPQRQSSAIHQLTQLGELSDSESAAPRAETSASARVYAGNKHQTNQSRWAPPDLRGRRQHTQIKNPSCTKQACLAPEKLSRARRPPVG